MAYMSQDRKKEIAVKVKEILKQYGVKGSLSVRHHMTLVLNIKSGKIDFISNFNEVMRRKEAQQVSGHLDVNPYWYQEHFTGEALVFLSKIFNAMNNGNHDNSDIQTDYFDVGWYVDVNIGQWNKPYTVGA